MRNSNSKFAGFLRGVLGAYVICSIILLLFVSFLGLKDAFGSVIPLQPFDVQSVRIHAKNMLKNGHDPLLVNGSVPNKELNLHIDTNVFEYLYYNNRVWSLWDQHQVRWIGLDFQVGAHILPWLDLEYSHFSRHILDAQYPYRDGGHRFPVEDAIGINLYLYRKYTERSIL